jgi:hypothetical protein
LNPVSTLELLPGGSFYGLTARNCSQCAVLTQTDREHSDECRDSVSILISKYFFVRPQHMQWRLDTSVHVADILNSDVRVSFRIDMIKTCDQKLWLVCRPIYLLKIFAYLHLYTSSSYLASISDYLVEVVLVLIHI